MIAATDPIATNAACDRAERDSRCPLCGGRIEIQVGQRYDADHGIWTMSATCEGHQDGGGCGWAGDIEVQG